MKKTNRSVRILTEGAILIALGVIGEYVGKIYSEVKRRPRYIEDCRCGMPEAGNGTPG